MGTIIPSEARNGLNGALRFFRENIYKIFKIEEVALSELYMFIIVLGVYLYSKYYRCGRSNKSSYTVVADDIRSVYDGYDVDIADMAYSIIITRNRAVHSPYIKQTDKNILDILKDKQLLRLLRIEGIVDKYGDFIEPENGEYTSAFDMKDALNGIESMIRKIKAEDKEDGCESESVESSGLISAISKMQGDE